MRKNFYLVEAYILGYLATFIFSKYFLLIHSDFNDVMYKFSANIQKFIKGEIILLGIIIIFLLLRIKFDNLLNNNYVRKSMYFFIFEYVFFKNYIMLRLNWKLVIKKGNFDD